MRRVPPQPDTVVCTYRVRRGEEAAFRDLLDLHWPTLRELGLVQDVPALRFQGTEPDGGPFFVEIFTWRDARAVEEAHHSGAVQSVWGQMSEHCEERGGRPAMEFPHVERL